MGIISFVEEMCGIEVDMELFLQLFLGIFSSLFLSEYVMYVTSLYLKLCWCMLAPSVVTGVESMYQMLLS